MEFFSRLFDSQWSEREDAGVRDRYSRHYDSMAGQVMASRNEIACLHSEVNRISQDLAQSVMLNRVLLKLLAAKGVATPEEMQTLLYSVLEEHRLEVGQEGFLSRFCENCGRPLPVVGQKCAYCTEIELPQPEVKKKTAKKKKKASSKNKGKKSGK